ncbi:MAG: ATP-binding protein [Roseiflexaceae bacterium]
MATSSDTLLDVSLFKLLRQEFGDALAPVRCTKATLVHLSHTLEDLVLREQLPALLFTGFQESSHWREETERYRALAAIAQQVCIFAGGTLPPESSAKELHVILRGDDPLRQEWFVVLLCAEFSALLCGQDRQAPASEEATRQFDTLWSFEPEVIERVLDLLERVVANYRPERLAVLQDARAAFPPISPNSKVITTFTTELIRFEEQLHQRLHTMTAVLNEQLRWRDDLTATLVHDMRSPLQGLTMSIEMLSMANTFDQETLTHMLGVAKRSTDGLTSLVQLILDTNQLAAGQLLVSWQPMYPTTFLTEALEPLQAMCQASNQRLDVQCDQRVKIMWGDKTLLGRVVQNLVSNASKFTPQDGEIYISIVLAPSGKDLELRVRDTGAGMSPAALPHIFDRYYQASKDDRRGTGLGLYFCKLAIEAHRGTIRATSQVGSGATMTIVVPLLPPGSAVG